MDCQKIVFFGQQTCWIWYSFQMIEMDRQVIYWSGPEPLPVNHFKKWPEGPLTLFEFNGKFKMKVNKRNESSSYLLKLTTNCYLVELNRKSVIAFSWQKQPLYLLLVSKYNCFYWTTNLLILMFFPKYMQIIEMDRQVLY